MTNMVMTMVKCSKLKAKPIAKDGLRQPYKKPHVRRKSGPKCPFEDGGGQQLFWQIGALLNKLISRKMMTTKIICEMQSGGVMQDCR